MSHFDLYIMRKVLRSLLCMRWNWGSQKRSNSPRGTQQKEQKWSLSLPPTELPVWEEGTGPHRQPQSIPQRARGPWAMVPREEFKPRLPTLNEWTRKEKWVFTHQWHQNSFHPRRRQRCSLLRTEHKSWGPRAQFLGVVFTLVSHFCMYCVFPIRL